MKTLCYPVLFYGLLLCFHLSCEKALYKTSLEDLATAFLSVKSEFPHKKSQENNILEDLKNAILDENLEKIGNALDAGADINSFYLLPLQQHDIYSHEYSVLGLALHLENQDIINLIISKKPNLEKVRVVRSGPKVVLSTSALYEALEIGNLNTIKLILSQNPHLKVVAHDILHKKTYSALQVAIQKGNLSAVSLILKKLIENKEPNLIKYTYWAHEALKDMSKKISSSELQAILEGKDPSKNNLKLEFETRAKILGLIERASQAQKSEKIIPSKSKRFKKKK